jgi:hypothetical protein
MMTLSSWHPESVHLVLSALCWSWAPLQGGLCLGWHWSPHTEVWTGVSGLIILSHVQGSQAVHLQKQCALDIFSGEGESPSHGVMVYVLLLCSFICPNHLYPFPGADRLSSSQSYWSWIRSCTGKSQIPCRCNNPSQTPPAAPHNGHPETQRILVRKLTHILTVPLTHVHSHFQVLLFYISHLLK